MPVMIGVGQCLGEVKPGEVIAGVKGLVKVVFDRATFTKKSGQQAGEESTVQKAVIQDIGDKSKELVVKLWNQQPLASAHVGKELWLVAHSGQKGLSGLRLKEDTYDGRSTLVLDVGDRAEVVIGGKTTGNKAATNTPPANTDDDIPFDEPPAAEPKPIRRGAVSGEPLENGATWKGVGAQLDRYGALWAACFTQVANKVVVECEKTTGHKLELDQMREIATSLFIELNRKQVTAPETPWKGYAELPE